MLMSSRRAGTGKSGIMPGSVLSAGLPGTLPISMTCFLVHTHRVQGAKDTTPKIGCCDILVLTPNVCDPAGTSQISVKSAILQSVATCHGRQGSNQLMRLQKASRCMAEQLAYIPKILAEATKAEGG